MEDSNNNIVLWIYIAIFIGGFEEFYKGGYYSYFVSWETKTQKWFKACPSSLYGSQIQHWE